MNARVLVISPTPFQPSIGGNRTRVGSLLNTLGDLGCIVHFLHINRELGDEVTMNEALGEKFHSVTYSPPQKKMWRVRRKLMKLVGHEAQYRYGVDEWWDPSAETTIRALQREHRFQVVIVEYVYFSRALELFPQDVLKVLDTHDVFADRHRIYLERGEVPLWYSMSKRQEAKGLRRADVVLAIQDNERRFFERLVTVPIVTVGHVVDLACQQRSPIKNRLLYVGSKNPINVQSLKHFIKNVLHAKLRAKIPEIQLIVAGTVCDELEDEDGLTRIGHVDDLSEQYQLADVVVNPTLYGTGLKIKSIEALGYSRPLVTTSVGAEGMEEGIDSSFLVADTPEDFSGAIVRLLSNERLKKSMSESAYEFATRSNARAYTKLAECIASQLC